MDYYSRLIYGATVRAGTFSHLLKIGAKYYRLTWH